MNCSRAAGAAQADAEDIKELEEIDKRAKEGGAE